MYPLEAAELGRAGSSSGDSNCIGSLRLSTAAWLEFTGMLQGTAELLKSHACQSKMSCHVPALNSIKQKMHRTMASCQALLKYISAHRPSSSLLKQSCCKATSATYCSPAACRQIHAAPPAMSATASRLCMQSALARQAGSAPLHTVPINPLGHCLTARGCRYIRHTMHIALTTAVR